MSSNNSIAIGEVVAEGSKAISRQSASTVVLKKNVGTYVVMGLLVLTFMFVGVFTWAYFAKLDSATVAMGRVIVASRNKQIQHLDGGIVKDIPFKDGDEVKVGDVLLAFDDTQLRLQLNSVNSQLWETEASIVRLQAESDEKEELSWDGTKLDGEDIPDEVRRTQEQLFASRRRGLGAGESVSEQRRMQSQSQIESLENQKRGLYASIKGREQEIAAQNQLIKQRQQQYRAQLERIKGQGQNKGGQHQQILGLQQQIKNQQQQAAGLQQRIAGAQGQVKELEAQIGSNFRQKQSVDKEVARLKDLFKKRLIRDQELREMERSSERVTSVIAGLKGQISSQNTQIKQFHNDIKRTHTEISRIQTEIQRMKSQIGGTDSETETMKAEAAGILAGIKQVEAGIGGIKADIGRIQTEIARTDSDIKRLREGMVEIGYQNDAQKEDFRTQAGRELSQRQGQLPQLIAQKQSLEDRLDRIKIISPADGKIKGLEVTTKGAVISPGKLIMEIVPEDNNFKIIAEIEQKDIDSVAPGLEAEIKLSVFDNAQYFPVMTADVLDVATDTQTSAVTNQPYYKALLEIRPESMDVLSENGLNLVSGMPVEVMVKVGERTVLDYLLKPIERVFARSFTEA